MGEALCSSNSTLDDGSVLKQLLVSRYRAAMDAGPGKCVGTARVGSQVPGRLRLPSYTGCSGLAREYAVTRFYDEWCGDGVDVLALDLGAAFVGSGVWGRERVPGSLDRHVGGLRDWQVAGRTSV
jgi:hypothetical protein